MKSLEATLAALASLSLATALVFACSGPSADARIGIEAPDPTQFDPVGDLLDHRCGSLDCHGNAQRNLVVWGCDGLRIEPPDATAPDGGPLLVPGCRNSGGKNTTAEEYTATYRSLVSLEPTIMGTVVAGGGAHPELLTFIRKARGWDAHKGGQLWDAGDVSDTCVTSWLAGTTNTQDCTMAVASTP